MRVTVSWCIFGTCIRYILRTPVFGPQYHRQLHLALIDASSVTADVPSVL